MRFSSTKMLVALFCSGLMMAAGNVMAQERPSTPEPPKPAKPARPAPSLGQQNQPSVDVSDKEVEQFAGIYEKAMKIRSEYAGQAQNAKNREAAMRLRKEMNAEMMQVIKDSPMSVQRYQQIARAASSDKELQNELKQAIQQ